MDPLGRTDISGVVVGFTVGQKKLLTLETPRKYFSPGIAWLRHLTDILLCYQCSKVFLKIFLRG